MSGNESNQCNKQCVCKCISIFTILIATILIIFGIAAWNEKYITTCTITSYHRTNGGDCSFEYYTPGNKNCTKQTHGFIDGSFCDLFKSYGTPGTSVGPTVPCLVSTNIDWSKCPTYVEKDPYFNYLSKIPEAPLCVLIGSLIILLNTIVLICYIFSKVQIVDKLSMLQKTSPNYNSC